MKIKIEKKSENKFLLTFIKEDKIEGFMLSKTDLSKLKNNIQQMFEYNLVDVGDAT